MYLSFDEAREYNRKLNLKSAWQKYYQGKIEGLLKPNNIPWNPKKIYEKVWKGIKNWLGIDWRDFHEARSFVRSLNLKSQKEWRMYYKDELMNYELKPLDIPTDPQRTYNKEWIDMYDWLGKSK